MRTLTLVSFLLLAACGQSGDLYLPPPEQPAAQPAAPAAEPAGEDPKKEPPKPGH